MTWTVFFLYLWPIILLFFVNKIICRLSFYDAHIASTVYVCCSVYSDGIIYTTVVYSNNLYLPYIYVVLYLRSTVP